MGQPLPEITLPVQERDPDERQPEIAGCFGVVAGKHAETTGVDGQRGVDAELGGEIGDGSLDQLRLVLADPGRRGVGREQGVESRHHLVISGQIVGIGGRLPQSLWRDGAQQAGTGFSSRDSNKTGSRSR